MGIQDQVDMNGAEDRRPSVTVLGTLEVVHWVRCDEPNRRRQSVVPGSSTVLLSTGMTGTTRLNV